MVATVGSPTASPDFKSALGAAPGLVEHMDTTVDAGTSPEVAVVRLRVSIGGKFEQVRRGTRLCPGRPAGRVVSPQGAHGRPAACLPARSRRLAPGST